MKIMLEPKLLSSAQELIYSLNRKTFVSPFKTETVNATYGCKLQIICLFVDYGCGINVFLWNDCALPTNQRQKS